MGRSSGFRIVLLAAPSQRRFGASGMSCCRKVEGGSTERLSSPVTAARQRRIFTGLPGTHPQPSRCLEGDFNYSQAESKTQEINFWLPTNADAKRKLARDIRKAVLLPNRR